jgi:hypothetical protein
MVINGSPAFAVDDSLWDYSNLRASSGSMIGMPSRIG